MQSLHVHAGDPTACASEGVCLRGRVPVATVRQGRLGARSAQTLHAHESVPCY